MRDQVIFDEDKFFQNVLKYEARFSEELRNSKELKKKASNTEKKLLNFEKYCSEVALYFGVHRASAEARIDIDPHFFQRIERCLQSIETAIRNVEKIHPSFFYTETKSDVRKNMSREPHEFLFKYEFLKNLTDAALRLAKFTSVFEEFGKWYKRNTYVRVDRLSTMAMNHFESNAPTIVFTTLNINHVKEVFGPSPAFKTVTRHIAANIRS